MLNGTMLQLSDFVLFFFFCKDCWLSDLIAMERDFISAQSRRLTFFSLTQLNRLFKKISTLKNLLKGQRDQMGTKTIFNFLSLEMLHFLIEPGRDVQLNKKSILLAIGTDHQRGRIENTFRCWLTLNFLLHQAPLNTQQNLGHPRTRRRGWSRSGSDKIARSTQFRAFGAPPLRPISSKVRHRGQLKSATSLFCCFALKLFVNVPDLALTCRDSSTVIYNKHQFSPFFIPSWTTTVWAV